MHKTRVHLVAVIW